MLIQNPLDPDSPEPNLLIIFDGLDELAMQGKVGAEIAREFIDEVDRTVDHYNYQKIRLQVLITGREVVVQAQRHNPAGTRRMQERPQSHMLAILRRPLHDDHLGL